MAGGELIDVIRIRAIHEGLGVELVVGGVVGHGETSLGLGP